MIRRLAWIGAGVVGLGLGGGSAAVGWLQSEGGRAWIAGRIEQALAGALETGAVGFGTVAVGPSGVVIGDLRVHGPVHDDLVVVPRTTLTVSWTSMLRRRVWIDELVLESPTIRLYATESGIELPTVPASDAPGPVTYLPAGWVADARVRIVDGTLQGPDDLAFTGIDLSASVYADPQRVEVRGLSLRAHGTSPPTGEIALDGTFALVGPDLAELTLGARGPGLALRVDGAIPSALGAAPTAELDVVATGEPAAWPAWVGAPELPVAELGLRAAIDGPLSNPSVHLGGSWADAPPGALVRRPQVTVDATVASLDPLALDVEGRVRDLGALQGFGVPLDEGVATLSGRVVGPLDAIRATLSGQVRDLAVGTVTAEIVDLRSEFDLATVQTTAEIRSTTVDVAGETELPIALVATVTHRGTALDVVAQAVDRRAPERRLDVALSADLDTSTATVTALTLRPDADTTWGQVEPSVVRWDVPAIRTRLQSAVGALSLDVAQTPGGWPTGAVDATNVALGAVVRMARPFVPDPLPALDGTLTATIRTREGPRYPFEIRAAEVSWPGHLSALGAFVDGTLTPDGVAFDVALSGHDTALGTVRGELPLVSPQGPSSLGLRCGPDAAATVEIEGAPTTLGDWASTFPAFEPPSPELRVDGRATLAGDPCDPALDAGLTAAMDVEGRPLTARLSVRDLGDHEAHAELTATLGRGAHSVVVVRATGTAAHGAAQDLVAQGLDQVGAFQFAAELADLPTGLFDPRLGGRLGGTARVTGHGAALSTAKGALTFVPAVAGALPGARARWDTEAEGDLVVAMDVDPPSDPDGLLPPASSEEPTLTARLPLGGLVSAGADVPLTGQIHGLRLAVADLVALAEADVRKPEGWWLVDGPVRGTLANPEPALRVELIGGAATIVATGVRYDDVHVVSELAGRTLTVKEGVLTSRPRGRTLRRRGRRLRLRGTVALDEARELVPDLELTLDRSWLLASAETTLQASGTVRLHRPAGRLRLDGRVVVDEGRALLDRGAFADGGSAKLDSDIRFVDAPPSTALRQVGPPAASTVPDLDLDLTIDLGSGVAVEATVPLVDQADAVGRSFSVTVDGALEGTVRVVQGAGDSETPELDLRGRLATSGRVELLGARFDIEEGVVAFAGRDLMEPSLDLRLNRDTRSYGTVSARIRGTPSSLQLTDLTSDAGAEQADVVALLLFGRPLSEFDPDSGGAGSDVVEAAVAAVAGKPVEDALGGSVVDTVRYSTDGGLSLGWNLGSTGFLTVRVDPLADDGENTAVARLTWLLSRRVEVGVETGDTGTASSWFIWRRRF